MTAALMARNVTLIPPSAPGFLNIVRHGAVDGGGTQVPLGPLMISSRA